MADLDNKDILARIRERWPKMQECDRENREMALRDMMFLNIKGEQWDDNMRKDRGGRPSYEFNEAKIKAKRIINEMRANRPIGKVRAVEDGDADTAEVMEGLMRNIWSTSKGDHITDYAAGYQVGGGMAAWRVTTQYSADDGFDQDIVVEPIMNPFCLWWDETAKDQLKRDARDWFLGEKISKEEFERRWPKAEVVDFEADSRFDERDWRTDSEVRIGEYWWKQPAKKELLRLKGGKTVDAAEYKGPPDAIEKRRTIDCDEIWMCIVGGGDTILEKPVKWAGRHFPFVVVFGEYVIIEGKVYWWGLTRDMTDAQQGFNVAMTSIVETIADAPQSKYWATAEQALGHVDQWAQAHKERFPFMLYNSDSKVPGPPVRMPAPDVPVALIQLAGMMRDNLKAVSGVFDASLGATSNETSGRAINARQQQGEIANFHFQDNMALGVQWSWEITMDLVPHVFDAERSIRILGSDLAEKYVKVNAVQLDDAGNPVLGPDGKPVLAHDLSAGKYDLAVTVGPSWSTRRQEAVEMYGELGQTNPALWQIAGDLLFKAMDLPYADEIAERMKTLLPPQIQQQMSEGKEIPPEVQQAMAQVQAAMQQVEQQGQLVQAAAAEAEQGKTEAQKAQMGVQSAVNDLKVQRAQFEGEVAKQMASLMQKEATIKLLEGKLEQRVSEVEAGQQQGEFQSAASETIAGIQQMAQEFTATAQTLMQAMNAKEQQLSSRIDQEIGMLMQSPPPGSQGAPTEAPLQ